MIQNKQIEFRSIPRTYSSIALLVQHRNHHYLSIQEPDINWYRLYDDDSLKIEHLTEITSRSGNLLFVSYSDDYYSTYKKCYWLSYSCMLWSRRGFRKKGIRLNTSVWKFIFGLNFFQIFQEVYSDLVDLLKSYVRSRSLDYSQIKLSTTRYIFGTTVLVIILIFRGKYSRIIKNILLHWLKR